MSAFKEANRRAAKDLELLEKVVKAYKPWGQVPEWIEQISYKPEIEICCNEADLFWRVWLRQEVAVDTETGDKIEMEGHSTYIPCNATHDQVVREVYYLCLRWEMHELQEFFKVDGKRPFNPHHSLEDLMQLD